MASKLKLRLIVTLVIFCFFTIIQTSQRDTRDVTKNTKTRETTPPITDNIRVVVDIPVITTGKDFVKTKKPQFQGAGDTPFQILTFGVEITEESTAARTARIVERITTESGLITHNPTHGVLTTETIMMTSGIITEVHSGQGNSPGEVSTTAKSVDTITTDNGIFEIPPNGQGVLTTETIMTSGTITQSVDRIETATTFPNKTLTHGGTSDEYKVNQTLISDMVFRYHSMHHLLEDIFLDYDKRLRPRDNQSRFVFIQSTFVPLKIIDFDTLKNNFTLMGYFRMQWRDDFLTWTPEDYGNTPSIRIPANSVWVPRLSIAKGQSNRKSVGNSLTDIVVLTNKGYIQWWPEGIYSVVCEINIKYFPLDEQVCTLTYYIADEDDSTVKLALRKPIIMEAFSENAQWDLKNITSEIQLDRNTYMVHFNFTIKRRAGFAMYTLLLPAFLMSGLCCCTFLVPVETGEKGSIAVNVFLACIVYVTLVTHNVPKNSVELSYFVLYVVYLLSISALSTLYTIVQSYLYHHRNSIGCKLIASVFCQANTRRSADLIAFTISSLSVIGCMTAFLIFLY